MYHDSCPDLILFQDTKWKYSLHRFQNVRVFGREPKVGSGGMELHKEA